MSRRIIFFLLSVVFATSSAIVFLDTSMKTATATQSKFDGFVRTNNRTGLVLMLTSDFYYEDCRGKKYASLAFADLALKTKGAGRVLEARADKNHIIYKVSYPKKRMEVMITEKMQGWVLERAQDLIC